MTQLRIFASALMTLLLNGCVQYSFTEVAGVYSKPGNLEVTFRIIDPITGESPDLTGKNISRYLQFMEDGEPLSNSEGRSIEFGNAKTLHLDTLVALDLSGSVSRSLPDLQEAAQSFVSKILSNPHLKARIAIVSFDGNKDLRIEHDFTDNRSALLQTISSLRPGNDPSTNLYGAIKESVQLLSRVTQDGLPKEERYRSIYKKALVFFTDGKDQAGRVPESEAIASIRKARSEFLLVSSVVVGSEISLDFLESFGPKYHGYFPVSQYSALASAFDQVSLRLQRIGGSYFSARICSPKRRGIHHINLISLAQSREYPQDPINIEFNANGFTGGCNVKDEAQWNQNRDSRTSSILTDEEVDLYDPFLTRFDRFDSQVLFKTGVPLPGPNRDIIWNFSPLDWKSTVKCHLFFGEKQQEIAPNTVLPVTHYHSAKDLDQNVGRPVYSFLLDVGPDEASPLYQLKCFPVQEMIRHQATIGGGARAPERYSLSTIDIINGNP